MLYQGLSTMPARNATAHRFISTPAYKLQIRHHDHIFLKRAMPSFMVPTGGCVIVRPMWDVLT